MKKEKTDMKDENMLTKKDLNKCYIRLSLWGETSLNFERMQGIGFCNAMIPALKKLYTTKEDLSEALKRHLQFFNTELIASMAAKGNMISIAIMLALFAAFEVTAYLLFRLGYKTGRMSFTKIMKSGKLDELLDSANILGMFMMGVLSSNLVSLTPKLKIGKFVLKNMLDGILPGLLPLLVVFGVYYLIKKKQVSTAKIVILLIAIGIAGSAIGLF